MNIHHLELFYHVARHRGISAASRRMPYGIQQPAISGQISQLEKHLGLKLFHRRPFGLTVAGLQTLPDQIRGHAQRQLRLAAPSLVLRDYLPEILRRYKHRDPNFRLTLHDVNQATAEELLNKGEIDLAISELEGKPSSSISSCMLIRLPLVLVVPKSVSARTAGDFFREAQPRQNLISLPPSEVISKLFQTGLKKLKRVWNPGIEVTSLDLVNIYTALGFGVGISVRLPGVPKKNGLRLIALRQFPSLTVAALWVGQLSDPAAKFLADVQKLAKRLNERQSLES